FVTIKEDERVKKVEMLVLVHKGVASSQGGGDAGAGSQHAGVGGSQTTQSSTGRLHPSVLHASPSKMTKSSARRGGS
ncbi:hypothetical protein Tco_0885351, partial [Tanacetum coccineum]